MDEDDATADEAEPGDDLRRHPRGVELHLSLDQDVAEAVLADQREQGRPQPDDRVRAQPRGLLTDLPFQPDRAGESERDAELGGVRPVLSERFIDVECHCPALSVLCYPI